MKITQYKFTVEDPDPKVAILAASEIMAQHDLSDLAKQAADQMKEATENITANKASQEKPTEKSPVTDVPSKINLRKADPASQETTQKQPDLNKAVNETASTDEPNWHKDDPRAETAQEGLVDIIRLLQDVMSDSSDLELMSALSRLTMERVSLIMSLGKALDKIPDELLEQLYWKDVPPADSQLPQATNNGLNPDAIQ